MALNLFFLFSFILAGKVAHRFCLRCSPSSLNLKIHSIILGIFISSLFFFFLFRVYNSSFKSFNLLVFLLAFSALFFLYTEDYNAKVKDFIQGFFLYFHQFLVGTILAGLESIILFIPIVLLRVSSELEHHGHKNYKGFKKLKPYLPDLCLILGFFTLILLMAEGYSRLAEVYLLEIFLSLVIANVFYSFVRNLFFKKTQFFYFLVGEAIFLSIFFLR